MPVPQPAAAVTLGGSPADYTANSSGSLAVSGGTVSSITLTRGLVTVPTGVVAGLIPMEIGDVVSITYAVAPTVNFLPTT